ncbi:hypothetical protein MOQ_006536 [Trypanosoma cruzi marinkellei]|uniref:Reverse transcriptase domain-containing protein n=1 Tax=Trypanosoma cruzi marinkellei TaxID=85056 RepID=K2N4S1_TRYCR|nr:hypothetical protein MOQ_006536 [Trypanosoma cruzi marinkellei]
MQLAHLIHEVEHNRNDYFQVNLPKKSGIGNQLHYRPHRTLLVLVDFSKALDSMDHRVLSRLLANIPGVNCRRWHRNFLCGRYAKKRVGNRHSDRRRMLRGVSQGSVLGPYLFSPYVHPLLNLPNSFAGVTADMYADDLSIIVKGRSREDAIPTANMVLEKLHAWSRENGLAINPSKCEAAWFTLSTHTESDYDREGKWPLEVAGCKIPVMTMGASRTTKLLGMDLDPRLTLNVAVTKRRVATSQRISQPRCIAHKGAGPSPHDLRAFVIGYGASKLRYGSELIWEVATDSAKNEMQKTYATQARVGAIEAQQATWGRLPGKKPPLLEETRLMGLSRVKTRPNEASPHKHIERVARLRAEPGRRETAPDASGQFWETTFPSLHAFAFLRLPLGRPFWYRRRGATFPRIRLPHFGPTCMERGCFLSRCRSPGRIKLLATGG